MSIRPRRRPARARRPVLLALPLAVLVVVVGTALPPTGAAFTATASNAGNTAAAAAVFPDYPTQVGTAPQFWHRGDDAVSSAATSAAADSSGHSLPGVYDGATDGPSTWWRLNDASGATATDASGAANPGTLTNGPTWTTGERAGGLLLDGVDDSVTGARAAVDTRAGFTVSAWARLTDFASTRTVVSQDGSAMSGFYLQYVPSNVAGTGFWRFAAFDQDTNGGGGLVVSDSAPYSTVNQWVHLTGVFDATNRTISLYVNGVLQGTPAARSAAWAATGNLVVGRGRYNGTPVDYFKGGVDDVKTWRRALTAAEVRDEWNGRLRGDWDFETVSGGATPSSSRTASASLTLHGGAVSETLSGGDHALRLPGTTADYADRVATIATDRSFTVAAWVNASALAGAYRVAVSQSGTQKSAFYLEYVDDTKHWSFTVPDTDSTSSGALRAESSAVAATNTWTHLTGVFDAEKDEIRLYVGGVWQSTTVRTASWNATGAFTVGQGTHGGAPVNPFAGLVDHAVVYQRALSDAAVADLVAGRDPDVTPVGFSAGLPGALEGPEQNVTPNRAVAFAGSTGAYNSQLYTNPGPFTVECWFRTTTPGGALFGFGQYPTFLASGNSDRMVYLSSTGELVFGVYVSGTRTVKTTGTYADGKWHHLAASLGAAGMRLSVDGALVASDATVTTAQNFPGYWRFGSARTDLWPSATGNRSFTGTIDEFAVHPTQLSDRDVARHAFANF